MEQLKKVFNEVLDVFQGSNPSVYRYYDQKNIKYVDILSCKNSPDSGFSSCATLGLSQIDTGWVSDGKKLRIELVGTCETEEEFFPNILSTAAFEIMDSGAAAPGAVIKNVVSWYIEETTTPHLFLTTPSMWDKEITPVSFPDTIIDFLMVVPISHAEWKYLNQHGEEAFENLLADKQIDIRDFFRDSAC